MTLIDRTIEPVLHALSEKYPVITITGPRQVSRDPLRGNLFENMVVAEALKYRFNQGKKSNLYFYRDRKGNEVDLVCVTASSLLRLSIA